MTIKELKELDELLDQAYMHWRMGMGFYRKAKKISRAKRAVNKAIEEIKERTRKTSKPKKEVRDDERRTKESRGDSTKLVARIDRA